MEKTVYLRRRGVFIHTQSVHLYCIITFIQLLTKLLLLLKLKLMYLDFSGLSKIVFCKPLLWLPNLNLLSALHQPQLSFT